MNIYLDCNATTPLDPRVGQAMADSYAQHLANPSSQHAAGRRARKRLEAVRDSIARRLDLRYSSRAGDQILFTSGGTESNNLAVLGLNRSSTTRSIAAGQPDRVVLSPVEHPSVRRAADQLAASGSDVRFLTVDREGQVELERARDLITPETRLVSCQLANQETGVVQPIRELAEICRSQGVPLHTDAVQAVGKVPVSLRELGVSAMTVAPHKFHGPRGVGLLIFDASLPLLPLFWGGFQQLGFRPGTEPVELCVGVESAFEVWAEESETRTTRMEGLRNRWEQLLIQMGGLIHGRSAPRLPHTTCVSFPGHDRQGLVMALDRVGVSCSTGSACASGSSEPSPVLLAMGLEAELVESAVRFSLGAFTTVEEIDEAARRVGQRVLG